MKSSADNLIFCLIATVTVLATVVVSVQSYDANSNSTTGREFQSAVGGLGMGCQIDLSRCSWQFDPRLSHEENPGLNSVPCLSELSPWHSMALFPVASDRTPVEGD
jgi:hypothetical protein